MDAANAKQTTSIDVALLAADTSASAAAEAAGAAAAPNLKRRLPSFSMQLRWRSKSTSYVLPITPTASHHSNPLNPTSPFTLITQVDGNLPSPSPNPSFSHDV